MTRRIVWLVAATTSAVVIAFVVPLMVLIAGLAKDRATTLARDQAQATATIVAAVPDEEALARSVEERTGQGPPVLVVRADGRVLGRGATDDTAPLVDRARRDREAFTAETSAGLSAVVPVARPDGVDVVVASVDEAELRAGVPTAWAIVVGLGAALVATSVLVAWRLGRRVAVPVTELADVAHRLREGDASARATPGGPPETAELGQALNALADRIHDLVAAEREHVADLGHRLRTPVTALRLDAEMVDDPVLSARLRDHVEELRRSIDDVVREARRPLVDDLLRPTDLVAVVRDRVAFWRPLAEDQGRRMTGATADGPLLVPVGEDDALEILDTLLDNVFAHTPEGTAVTVLVGTGGGLVRLVVEDAGPGLDRPWAGRGDSGGGSTGLGLDIVHRIARTAGGRVTLGDSALGGLRVEVDLPLVTG